MKEIPNKQYKEKDTTVTLLKLALNFPTDRGLSLADIRARNRVFDAIEKVEVGGVIKLEDADHTTAVEAIKAVHWTTVNKDIIQFAEQFGL